ncbi:MAG: hypothetical protein G3M70_03940 [Candidatus Nitronauta litoralis]|uniref:Mechanosensitive ion channel n=1 Tax=Candidatus Nitronauta litoralis TaxID=2705533 RepID=A0A7T0FZQ0_9BACT|nr:MAG: hypothetical protein G3M70_03940 [Candidatus Nitronauta litoralis]
MKRHLWLVVLLFWLAGVAPAIAEKPAEPSKSAETSKPEETPEPSDPPKPQFGPSPIHKIQFQLLQISKRKLVIQKELEDLGKRDPSKLVLGRINELQAEMGNLIETYEALATQIPKEDISKDEMARKGWMEELQDITRPILNSLKDFSARPRKIDNLKAQILSLQNKIQAYEKARKHIVALEELKLNGFTLDEDDKKKSITQQDVLQKFQEELAKLKDQYDPEILKLELEEAQRTLQNLQSSNQNLFSLIGQAITEFMSVRGRNFLVALTFLFGLGWLLTLVYKTIESKTQLLNRINRSARKFIKAIYFLVIFLISFSASLFTLYLFDDWLLLSLLFLVLVAFAWTSRQFIPKFVQELKLILNLGTVREGERLFYEGIPWLVKEIGFHVTLHNPRLDGGIIRVPVGKMIGLSSRQFVKEEEWFPTKQGDWIFFQDETFGQIASQTPEQVILINKLARQVYLTPEFLTMKPRNISGGYAIVIKFGLDYSLQKNICEDIPNLFLENLEEEFKDHFESKPPVFSFIKVKFDTAGPSSLDLVVLVGVNANQGESYFSLRRDVNKVLVEVCNREGYIIPFNQMTVTMAPDDSTESFSDK